MLKANAIESLQSPWSREKRQEKLVLENYNDEWDHMSVDKTYGALMFKYYFLVTVK